MNFESLLKQHKALMTGRWLTDLANTSAFIFSEIPDLNWAGFYILEDDTLWLGPFQGKPACTEIKVGKGVCGTAVRKREVIVVPDVHQFAGHITCDPVSQSEIVVPLYKDSNIFGVLDVDSPKKNRFGEVEKKFFTELVANLNI